MSIIEQSARLPQGPSATLEENLQPPTSPLDTAQECISRLSPDRLGRILDDHEPPVPLAGPNLRFVFPLAKVRHREYFRDRKNEVEPEVLADLKRYMIRREESLAEWVNRNRPFGTPTVAGEPYWGADDEAFCWDVGNWSIFVYRHESGRLSITWAEVGADFWYVLSPLGDKEIEGNDWETAEEAA